MPGIQQLFLAQQEHKYVLRKSDVKARLKSLAILKHTIEDFEKDLYAALQQDLRKSHFETAVTELLFIYGELNYAIKHLNSWMKPRRAGKTISNLFARNRIYYEPKGVCLIMAPWNYPFQLVMSPLISAVAAGNCVMVKPSELSPETSIVIGKIIEKAFKPNEVACIQGNAEMAKELLELPFDHIFFTGSTKIGKLVMAAAAKNLTSVTLELGGKSPAIIDSTADLKKAAEKIAWGKLVNAGQTCIAPDYVLVTEEKEQDFINFYREAVEKMFLLDGKINQETYVKIINQDHFERLNTLAGDALSRGAELTWLGHGAEGELLPAVLRHVPEGSKIMEEEIFGPLLPVVTFKMLEDAINHVNKASKPLALYIFSNSDSNSDQVLKNTSSGGACINDVLVHISNPKLPFGGVNESGAGSCHGEFGFKTFSHERAVVFQSRFGMTSMIYPPYENKNGILKLLKKLM